MQTEYNKNPLPAEGGTKQFSQTAEALTRTDRTLDGVYSFDMSAGNVTINDSTDVSLNKAHYGRWKVTGLTAARELKAPSRSWSRIIENPSGFDVKVVLAFAGAGVTIPAGEVRQLMSDGTEIVPITAASTPTGTGVVKVVNGVQDAAASLIVNANVDAAAEISQSKIASLGTGFGSQSRLGFGQSASRSVAGVY